MSKHRYIRQIQLQSFGQAAQEKLATSSVLVVGAGGLGTPVLQYLSAMGVGRIGIVEHDTIDESNLHRQVIYKEMDVGQAKLEVAGFELQAQNSETVIEGFDTWLSSENALDILASFDVVVDASDNFTTRYLINDACMMLNKPFVYGALHGFEGQVSVFNYQNAAGERGPTYRCLFPYDPAVFAIPDCNANGVLGVLPGIVGCHQALEAVKVLTGVGEVLSGQLLIIDGLLQDHQKISFAAKAESQKIIRLQKNYGPAACRPKEAVPIDQLDVLLRDGQLVIDVRTAEEYESNYLAGTRNIPLHELGDQAKDLSVEREIYLLCASGKRSKQAIELLKAQHPEGRFYNISGGLNSYNFTNDYD